MSPKDSCNLRSLRLGINITQQHKQQKGLSEEVKLEVEQALPFLIERGL